MSCTQSETSQGGGNTSSIKVARASIDATSVELARAVARHLSHESEVIRSQAARALGQIGNTDVADMLQAQLVDEDPDVRVDAMHAFIRCARSEDAGFVRASLIGDPEFYVKKSALSVLAKLKDTSSVDLLCALASSRCNESVSWDESAHGWDEWLDLQPSVVRALADIGDDRCIDTLLSIRADEFALDLDAVVFKALLNLGDKGVQQVLQFLDDPDAAVRAQAVKVIATASPDYLVGHLDRLLSDNNAGLRLLAVSSGLCEPSSIRDHMLNDADATVRMAAIEQIASRYELEPALSVSSVIRLPIVDRDDEQCVLDTLNDTDERVRLAALSLSIRLGVVAGAQNDVVIDEIAVNDKFPLQQFPVSCFLNVMGDKAHPLLSQWLADVEAAPERRIYAAKSLSVLQTGKAYEALYAGLIDRVSQVRVACLEALVSWTRSTASNNTSELLTLDTTLRVAAVNSLAMAISGDVFAVPDVPKSEEHAQAALNSNSNIGQPITWYEHPVDEQAENEASPVQSTPLSTLEAIELANQPSVESRVQDIDDTSFDEIKRDKGARRRVSVAGPEAFEEDLRCLALVMCSQVADSAIERATLLALDDTSTKVVETALRALHERYRALTNEEAQLPGDLVGALMEFTTNDDPGIRYWAASVLLWSNGSDTSVNSVLVAQLMDDADALCRSLAMQHADTAQLCIGLADSTSTVRNAAVDKVLQGTAVLDVDSLIDILVENSATDTLRRVVNRHEPAVPLLTRRLQSSTVSANALNVLLGSMTAA